MSQQPSSAVLEQVRQTLAAHDPDVRVEVADDSGGVRVHSSLDEGTVLTLLRRAALPLAAADQTVRSDCCGGCCGG